MKVPVQVLSHEQQSRGLEPPLLCSRLRSFLCASRPPRSPSSGPGQIKSAWLTVRFTLQVTLLALASRYFLCLSSSPPPCSVLFQMETSSPLPLSAAGLSQKVQDRHPSWSPLSTAQYPLSAPFSRTPESSSESAVGRTRDTLNQT